MLNALSIDVEDYFHVSGFESAISRDTWDQWPARVVENTRRILAILREHAVRATFYVLGWVADRFPILVDEIHKDGHEIGSHSYWHRLVYAQSPEDFRDDLRRSIDALGARTGEPITAYRAPSFSVTKKSLWALQILADEGIRIDSSVFPARHDRYGIPGAETRIHRVPYVTKELWEFPPSVLSLGVGRLPVSGGGYFRLYPWQMTRAGLRQINRSGRPFVFYTHPWEFDPEQPRVPVKSRLSGARHYVNLHRTEARFHALLRTFRFGMVSDVVQQYAQREAQDTLRDLKAATTNTAPAPRSLARAKH